MQPPDDPLIEPRPPIDVARALQQLPLEQPRQSAWPELAKAVATAAKPVQRRHTRRRHWLAAAAGVLLAASLPALLDQAPSAIAPARDATLPDSTLPESSLHESSLTESSSPSADTPVATTSEIDALQRESAQLQAWLAQQTDAAVVDVTSAALQQGLLERVQWIDALLGDPLTDPATRLPLWRERVLSLRRLAAIESSQQRLVASGEADHSRLVMVF